MKLTSALSITDRAFKLFMVAVLAASSLVVLASSQVFAATKTWTGAGGNNNFSTAANWSDNSVPVNGDSLVFGMAGLADDEELTNDITNLTLVGILFTGNSEDAYTIVGNPITISGSISSASTDWYPSVNTGLVLNGNTTVGQVALGGEGKTIDTQGYSLSFSGSFMCSPTIAPLVGSGAVNTSANIILSGSPTWSGALNISGNTYVGVPLTGFGTTAGTTTVSGAANLLVINNGSAMLSEPLSLGGAGSISLITHEILATGCGGGSGGSIHTLTLNGPVTLTSDFKLAGTHNITVAGEYNANGHSFTVAGGSSAQLTLPSGGVIEAEEEVNEYSDNQPDQYVNVGNKQTAIINGTRGGTSVGYGGVLKGTGTVQWLSVGDGGIVAPGLSPGTLTVVDSLSLNDGAVFEAEIQSVDAYDQIVVTDGDVYLNDPTLRAIAYEGFELNQGDVFTIIDKQSDGAINGTFKDLPEGTTFAFGQGGVARISYVGGDGNDVTLTIVTVPTAPDTGFTTLMAQPWLVLVIVAVAGLGLVVLGRKLQTKR